MNTDLELIPIHWIIDSFCIANDSLIGLYEDSIIVVRETGKINIAFK